MNREEFKSLTGLKNIPVYWDRRYTKNFDKLSKPEYTVKFEESVPIKLRLSLPFALGIICIIGF